MKVADRVKMKVADRVKKTCGPMRRVAVGVTESSRDPLAGSVQPVASRVRPEGLRVLVWAMKRTVSRSGRRSAGPPWSHSGAKAGKSCLQASRTSQ